MTGYKVYIFCNFQDYSTVLLIKIIMLFIIFPELSFLATGNLCPLTDVSPSLHTHLTTILSSVSTGSFSLDTQYKLYFICLSLSVSFHLA